MGFSVPVEGDFLRYWYCELLMFLYIHKLYNLFKPYLMSCDPLKSFKLTIEFANVTDQRDSCCHISTEHAYYDALKNMFFKSLNVKCMRLNLESYQRQN